MYSLHLSWSDAAVIVLVGVGQRVLAKCPAPARKARYKAEQVTWQASGQV